MVNRKKQRHKLEQILSACGYKSDLSEADLSNFDEAMGTLKVYRLRYNLLKRKNPEAAEAEWVKGKLEAYLMCPDIFPKGERLKIYDDLVKYSNHVIKNAGDQRNFDWYVYDNYDILKQHTPEEVHPALDYFNKRWSDHIEDYAKRTIERCKAARLEMESNHSKKDGKLN